MIKRYAAEVAGKILCVKMVALLYKMYCRFIVKLHMVYIYMFVCVCVCVCSCNIICMYSHFYSHYSNFNVGVASVQSWSLTISLPIHDAQAHGRHAPVIGFEGDVPVCKWSHLFYNCWPWYK